LILDEPELEEGIDKVTIGMFVSFLELDPGFDDDGDNLVSLD